MHKKTEIMTETAMHAQIKQQPQKAKTTTLSTWRLPLELRGSKEKTTLATKAEEEGSEPAEAASASASSRLSDLATFGGHFISHTAVSALIVSKWPQLSPPPLPLGFWSSIAIWLGAIQPRTHTVRFFCLLFWCCFHFFLSVSFSNSWALRFYIFLNT